MLHRAASSCVRWVLMDRCCSKLASRWVGAATTACGLIKHGARVLATSRMFALDLAAVAPSHREEVQTMSRQQRLDAGGSHHFAHTPELLRCCCGLPCVVGACVAP